MEAAEKCKYDKIPVEDDGEGKRYRSCKKNVWTKIPSDGLCYLHNPQYKRTCRKKECLNVKEKSSNKYCDYCNGKGLPSSLITTLKDYSKSKRVLPTQWDKVEDFSVKGKKQSTSGFIYLFRLDGGGFPSTLLKIGREKEEYCRTSSNGEWGKYSSAKSMKLQLVGKPYKVVTPYVNYAESLIHLILNGMRVDVCRDNPTCIRYHSSHQYKLCGDKAAWKRIADSKSSFMTEWFYLGANNNEFEALIWVLEIVNQVVTLVNKFK